MLKISEIVLLYENSLRVITSIIIINSLSFSTSFLNYLTTSDRSYNIWYAIRETLRPTTPTTPKPTELTTSTTSKPTKHQNTLKKQTQIHPLPTRSTHINKTHKTNTHIKKSQQNHPTKGIHNNIIQQASTSSQH